MIPLLLTLTATTAAASERPPADVPPVHSLLEETPPEETPPLQTLTEAEPPEAALPEETLPEETLPEETLPDRVDDWLNSVVLLTTGSSFCSGVVIDDAGAIATAYHCVAAGRPSRVETRDGLRVSAEMISAVPRDDLALLSAPDLAGKVPPLPLRADAPRPGEAVYGLGHPFAPAALRVDALQGLLLWSVSAGIVSAAGPHLIQTDAALNPGNSGGPLVDTEGRVVGITSRKLNGDNVAFVSPSALVQEQVDEPRPPRRLAGGQIAMGLGSIAGLDLEAAPSLQIEADAILRDRLLAGMSIGMPVRARAVAEAMGRSWSPTSEARAMARLRLGRGVMSASLDLGAALVIIEELETTEDDGLIGSQGWTVGPALRLSAGGLGLRMVGWPNGETWTVLSGVSVGFPGVVSSF